MNVSCCLLCVVVIVVCVGHKYKKDNFTLVGCDVAYPTRQKVRQIKKMAPGTIPNASGLKSIY